MQDSGRDDEAPWTPHSQAVHEFICPLTHDIILDPVRTCDGHVFERSAILAWFAKWPGLSPLTGAMLPDSTLSPDDELRDRIQELISKKGRGGRQTRRHRAHNIATAVDSRGDELARQSASELSGLQVADEVAASEASLQLAAAVRNCADLDERIEQLQKQREEARREVERLKGVVREREHDLSAAQARADMLIPIPESAPMGAFSEALVGRKRKIAQVGTALLQPALRLFGMLGVGPTKFQRTSKPQRRIPESVAAPSPMPSPFLRGSPGSAPTQFAVSGSVDGSVRVWRLPDRTLLHELRGHSTWVCAVADLGNGVAASGGEDGTLRVWDCAHGKLLWDADVGREMIYAICAAPGGFVACSTGDKGAVQVWGVSERTAEFQHVATLEDHTDAVFALTVVSNPTEGGPPLLASASKDTTIRVWEVGSWECVGVLVAHTDSVVSVADLGEGKIASASKDGTLRVWSLEQHRCLAVAEKAHEGKAVESVCTLPGNRLCSGGDDNAVRMWLWDGKRLLRDAAPLHGHRGSVRAVAPVADDGRAVISCSWDGTMRLWDVREGAWLRNGDTSAVLQAKENDGWVETVAVLAPTDPVAGASPFRGPLQTQSGSVARAVTLDFGDD